MVALAQATETDTANAFTSTVKAIGQATETDTTYGFTSNIIALNQATETDSTGVLSPTVIVLNMAYEYDYAGAGSFTSTVQVLSNWPFGDEYCTVEYYNGLVSQMSSSTAVGGGVTVTTVQHPKVGIFYWSLASSHNSDPEEMYRGSGYISQKGVLYAGQDNRFPTGQGGTVAEGFAQFDLCGIPPTDVISDIKLYFNTGPSGVAWCSYGTLEFREYEFPFDAEPFESDWIDPRTASDFRVLASRSAVMPRYEWVEFDVNPEIYTLPAVTNRGKLQMLLVTAEEVAGEFPADGQREVTLFEQFDEEFWSEEEFISGWLGPKLVVTHYDPFYVPEVTTVDYRAEYGIVITDQYLQPVGDPIFDWTTLDVMLRFNEPGSGYFVAPGSDELRATITAGCRAVIIRYLYGDDGSFRSEIILAGPIEQWTEERADDGEKGGDGTFTVHVADDLASIVARDVYPNPAQTVETQDTDAWTYTGNAEAALRALVNLNAGQGALEPRRVPCLQLGPLASVGTNVTVTADRMQTLGDLARMIADAGGGLGFRTRQDGQEILFDVYDPPDVSGTVRFSFGLGNIKYLAYEVKAPTCTSAIVGGQGTGADSAMIERRNATDEAAWGRFEKFVARAGTTDLAVLQDDGDRELANGAATTRITANLADTPDQVFGIHYGLGYRVAIETRPGEQYADVVRGVHIQAWATSGELVSAMVGSQAAQTATAWSERLREIEARMNKLERNVTPA